MNGGFIINESRCPRCKIKRTVRLPRPNSNYCFNCRYLWKADGSSVEVEESVSYSFEPAELARLEIYRAAVRAGFYNEWESGSFDVALQEQR